MSNILITGANRGLGLEFTRQYAADGAHLIAACRDPGKAEALQQLAAKYKNVQIEALEVSDAKSITALAKKLENTPIDILINNAGIYSGGATARSAETGDKSQNFGTLDFDAWAKVLHINTIAPLQVLEAFMPHLRNSKEKKVANITSLMGSIGTMDQGSTAYRSSKAALNAAMQSIRGALKNEGVAWVNLHPGWVQTDMGGSGADITPEESITGMRKVIGELSLKNTGQFMGYNGKTILW